MTISPANSRRFRARKAAEYLGVSDSTLAKWRMRGDPPGYRKLGRVVVYDQADLDALLEACRRTSTSEPGR
jgi:predicted DNA-binding transcriptional regulator AlpA